jgi:adenylosuccinate synthase
VGGLRGIALTKLDVLDGFDEVKVCTGYSIDGTVVRDHPPRVADLERVVPVYETLPGWGTSTAGCTEWDGLPASARQLVDIVERETGVPVTMIGTGPARDAMVVRR